MIKTENEKYIIIDSENKNILRQIYIFIKENGKVLKYKTEDIQKKYLHPKNKEDEIIAKICLKKRII